MYHTDRVDPSAASPVELKSVYFSTIIYKGIKFLRAFTGILEKQVAVPGIRMCLRVWSQIDPVASLA